jgi:PhnB protein
MARVSTYLSFSQNTGKVLNFCKPVFCGEFESGGIRHYNDIQHSDGMLPLAEKDKNLVMHVALKICTSHHLMGIDAPESMRFIVNYGNNVHLNPI